jgi:leucyl/phenylalanyl-tRNA--protein transferase
VPVRRFPDPRSATRDGLVAVGGDLHPDTLRLAYRQGIFPWPAPGLPLLWFSPPERGVLDFADLHVPRSLERERRRSPLRLTVDADFPGVIRGCAGTRRPGQDGTWITAEIVAAYEELHRLGRAHSVEAWDGARLVGGIYGVEVDGAFAAESMFYRAPNASKLALLHLIAHLRARGLDWLDIQVLTPHMARLGARAMARDRFLARLAATRARGLRLFGA